MRQRSENKAEKAVEKSDTTSLYRGLLQTGWTIAGASFF